MKIDIVLKFVGLVLDETIRQQQNTPCLLYFERHNCLTYTFLPNTKSRRFHMGFSSSQMNLTKYINSIECYSLFSYPQRFNDVTNNTGNRYNFGH